MSKNKHSLPLLLWLNGGPGCSSLGFGALQELGPFRVYSDGKTLYKNKYAWNHAANVLFLESPAGVGFSYSNTSTDYARGDDNKTASDNYAFLLNWLERFPEYKNRDFYISGESYAGHFVPQLAHTIDFHNKKANKTIVKLKGIIIGNAVIDDESGERGMYDYLASHALISDETWTQIHKYCNFSEHAYAQSEECSAAWDEAGKSIDDIDVYNIYAPLCPSSADGLVTSKPKMASVLDFDPCSDNYVHAYLNRPDVQRALHANVTKLHFEWESCSEVIERWVDSPSTMIPVLQELMENGLRIWVFSGDTDGVVPVTSTKYAINKMKLPVKTAWHPWYINGQCIDYREAKMVDNARTRSLLCLLLLSFSVVFIAHVHGNKQASALGDLYKAKLKKGSNIDTSHFRPSPHLEGIRVLPQEGLKGKDKIGKLPGQPDVGFDQYGGYVTVNETAGRAFYYYFVEAQKSKDKKALLLWLNGGPGCSSLAYGAMQELGPFRVHSDGKTLFKNPFSWNHAANVLFLESPAGVGFSYSNTTSDSTSGGDKRTASDNYVFLLNWLERFPEYKDRDFYISGESYAGHYVPQLAHTILHFNKKANKTLINLKGIIIGNAVINDETDTIGMYDYFATHALISDETSYKIKKYCNFSPSLAGEVSEECKTATTEADTNIETIDIYNIYAPLCPSFNLTEKPKKNSVLSADPCSDFYVYSYLNLPEVQEALHANVTKLEYDWEPCSEVIKNWEDSPATMIPLLKEFMENGLRVWIFSGDMDGRIPVTSTKYSINVMKLPVKTQWHPWFLSSEVGGYTQVYKGDLTFTTVRGAGHQVPTYQPARALSMISHFLSGTPLPNP